MRKLLFLLLLPATALSQDQWKNVYTESAWAERDAWQKADKIIQQLSIGPGSRVADIGCHEGYMTFKLSSWVTPTGKVYSVDLDQTRLDKLSAHLQRLDIRNVITIKGNYNDPRLPAGSLDAVLILDTYHEMKSHDEILLKIKASLKKGGHLVICEPIMEARRNWPRDQQEAKHELGLPFVLEDLRKAGFQIIFKKDRFVDREKIKGDKMWIVVAIPKS